MLPQGLRLLFVEGYRPPSLQREYFEEYAGRLRASHPEWPDKKGGDAAAPPPADALFADASRCLRGTIAQSVCHSPSEHAVALAVVPRRPPRPGAAAASGERVACAPVRPARVA